MFRDSFNLLMCFMESEGLPIPLVLLEKKREADPLLICARNIHFIS